MPRPRRTGPVSWAKAARFSSQSAAAATLSSTSRKPTLVVELVAGDGLVAYLERVLPAQLEGVHAQGARRAGPSGSPPRTPSAARRSRGRPRRGPCGCAPRGRPPARWARGRARRRARCRGRAPPATGSRRRRRRAGSPPRRPPGGPRAVAPRRHLDAPRVALRHHRHVLFAREDEAHGPAGGAWRGARRGRPGCEGASSLPPKPPPGDGLDDAHAVQVEAEGGGHRLLHVERALQRAHAR